MKINIRYVRFNNAITTCETKSNGYQLPSSQLNITHTCRERHVEIAQLAVDSESVNLCPSGQTQ